MELPERRILTVSELTEEIKELLERQYPSVWVQGEVSNFRPAPSGHMYFTLKDDSAQIRCVMFKLQGRFLRFRLADGLKIIGWGRVSVYGPRGEYQLILDTMEPLGLGSLMLAFEQLKNRLAEEGLFDKQRKKAVPAFPKTIGVVTSPKGAAVRDMIRIITRRFPAMNILVSPTTVQGDRAPHEIVAAIGRLCGCGGVDVIIVGRGGGSVEDLWAFNDERVVRAVADCPLPIVSAVGHETDVTLTDFAADLRASTPSAAAEMLVPDRRDLAEAIQHLLARLRNSARGTLVNYAELLRETVKRLSDPRRQIEERRMRMDDLTVRLKNAVTRRMADQRREVETAFARLRPEYLRKAVTFGRQECEALRSRAERAMRVALKEGRFSLENLASQLEQLSPLGVLARGYSVTMRPDTGSVITDADSVRINDEVLVRLHRGRLLCSVTDKPLAEEESIERDADVPIPVEE